MFIGEIWFTKNGTDRKRLFFWVNQQIFHINNADDIVGIIFIHRETCMHIFFENFHQLFISRIHIYKGHINAGDHNISGDGITKVKNIIDHLLFFAFNDAFFLTYIDQGTQLMFRHGIGLGIGVYMEKCKYTVCDLVDNKYYRCKEHCQSVDHSGIGQCKFFGMDGCQIFRGDLTEDQDQ